MSSCATNNSASSGACVHLSQAADLMQSVSVKPASMLKQCSVACAGEQILCKSVVITTGTFLRGIIHVGSKTKAAGRMPSSASQVLWHTHAFKDPSSPPPRYPPKVYADCQSSACTHTSSLCCTLSHLPLGAVLLYPRLCHVLA